MEELSTPDVLTLLQTGTMNTEGLLPWSSNYTFLVQVCGDDSQLGKVEVSAVYKPRRGERPLWDFSQGTLCQRERAAFLISEALGWCIVPPTVLREGAHGFGSVQRFVEHDPEHHYFTIEGDPRYRTQLQKISLFDILVNNADRKSGHVLLEESDAADDTSPSRLWGIDHGICFHTEYKLRTVIWEFVGQPIPATLLADLVRLSERMEAADDAQLGELTKLLAPRENQALRRRLRQLLAQAVFPNPGPGRHYPWPPV
ncbi:MAG: SCO1664 family protein [Anaerolineales bacterium]|nr:SCO1664 family protein [Anaerolineales bacterium]